MNGNRIMSNDDLNFRNNSSLCIPRKCVSKAAILSLDIGEIFEERKLSEIIDIVMKFFISLMNSLLM